MSAQSEPMRRWLDLIKEMEAEAAGDVVSRRCPLDLWRLSGIKQVNDTWFEFTMTVDSDNLRAEALTSLGRQELVIRANAARMPAVRSEVDAPRARQDFLTMAMCFLIETAVKTDPEGSVSGLPAYVWPTWIRDEVAA